MRPADALRRAIRILHLEDNPRDAEMIRRHLDTAGLDCRVVHVDGRDAFEAALTGAVFDIVLCDFMVPGYDALQALAWARETSPGVPFVVISGELSEEQAVECLRAGATDYLLKHRLQRLVPAVERALEEAVGRRRRAEAETERKRAEQSLRRSYMRLKELSRRRVEVEEEERRNIHRELHDRIGQDLAAIKLNVELLHAALARDSQRALRVRLDDTRRLVQTTIDNTRNIMAELRPTGLDEFGLVIALRTHADTVARRLGIPVRVSGADPSPRLATGVETAIYRIAQEALNNVAKHSSANAVAVTLAAHGPLVTLTVVDDGAGFDVARLPADSYGLRVMRERAEAVGAQLKVDSAPGRGTRIVVRLEEAHEPQDPAR